MRQDSLVYARLTQGVRVFQCLEVKQKRLLTHSPASAVDLTRQERFTFSMAGSGGGRRDCRRGAALSSLLIKPIHCMACSPVRHMHRACAWINPYKPRQGSPCLSCNVTCMDFGGSRGRAAGRRSFVFKYPRERTIGERERWFVFEYREATQTGGMKTK